MKTFRYVVVLQVEVESFTEGDAKETLLDTFGPGTEGAVEVTDVSIREAK